MVERPTQQLQVPVDWDTLVIEDNRDDVGRSEIIDDEVMYDLLGFRAQDEAVEKAREAVNIACSEQTPDSMEFDTTGAAIVVDDYLPGEIIVVHDPNRPRMALGTVYPNQQEFRLAVRQFAINEFELDTVKTDKSRNIYGCKAEDCPWHLVGRMQPDRHTIMVLTSLL